MYKKLSEETEKEQIRTNLFRAISHDLRTPLTSIIGASSSYLANMEVLSEAEKTSLVTHIHEDSDWLLNMVENLLSITRINSETSTVNKTCEPIEEVLSEAIFRFKKRMPAVSVSVTAPHEFLMIPMDAMLIEQVIINLLEHAAVYSHSMDNIDCFVKIENDKAIFSIKHYGTAIPKDRISTIFDGTCTNESNSSDAHKGMGIGLFICKTIILAHGGDIWAENHEHGAMLSFSLNIR